MRGAGPPLSALRAFAAASRHLSFTLAAAELCVTQAAVSHQVRGLEASLGVALFHRTSRGLALTDEGAALSPALIAAFDAITRCLQEFGTGGLREVLTVGAVGTFVVGALLDRLPAFRAAHPLIDLRLSTHNNKVDPVAEGLDYAIRFGDGAWPGLHSEPLSPAPLSPLCAPALAETLRVPADLAGVTLLRSYRARDWPEWFAAADCPPIQPRGPQFDSSLTMVHAALRGDGVALAPPAMFERDLAAGRLVRPFAIEADAGRYWLSGPRPRKPTPAMAAFRAWLLSWCNDRSPDCTAPFP